MFSQFESLSRIILIEINKNKTLSRNSDFVFNLFLFYHVDKIITHISKFKTDCSFLALPLVQICVMIEGLQPPVLALLVPIGHGVDEENAGMLLNNPRSP